MSHQRFTDFNEALDAYEIYGGYLQHRPEIKETGLKEEWIVSDPDEFNDLYTQDEWRDIAAHALRKGGESEGYIERCLNGWCGLSLCMEDK